MILKWWGEDSSNKGTILQPSSEFGQFQYFPVVSSLRKFRKYLRDMGALELDLVNAGRDQMVPEEKIGRVVIESLEKIVGDDTAYNYNPRSTSRSSIVNLGGLKGWFPISFSKEDHGTDTDEQNAGKYGAQIWISFKITDDISTHGLIAPLKHLKVNTKSKTKIDLRQMPFFASERSNSNAPRSPTIASIKAEVPSVQIPKNSSVFDHQDLEHHTKTFNATHVDLEDIWNEDNAEHEISQNDPPIEFRSIDLSKTNRNSRVSKDWWNKAVQLRGSLRQLEIALNDGHVADNKMPSKSVISKNQDTPTHKSDYPDRNRDTVDEQLNRILEIELSKALSKKYQEQKPAMVK